MLKYYLFRFLVWLHILPRPEYLSQIVSEHPNPEAIVNGVMMVVKDGQLEKWACFRCPCGCGQRIYLSLSKSRRPRWSFKADWFCRPTL